MVDYIRILRDMSVSVHICLSMYPNIYKVISISRCGCPSYKDSLLIAIATVCFMLPWQVIYSVLYIILMQDI